MEKKKIVQNINSMNFSKYSLLKATILRFVNIIRKFVLNEVNQTNDHLLEFLLIKKLKREFKSELKNNKKLKIEKLNLY